MTDTSTTPAPELTRTGLVAVLTGAALAPVDLFVVNVALPAIRTDLGASPAALEWVVTAYSLGFAVLLVLGGRLGDAVGRRRMFVLGLAGFTVTSLACGLAPDVTTLVAARAAQGVTAAMVVPQALSVIQAGTSGPRRARALGYYGATGGIAMVVGPLLGGVLVGADVAGAGWRPVFLVNVPIGLVAVALAVRHLAESRATSRPGLDVPGTLLLGATMLMLLVPLTEGPGLGWPVRCVALLALVPVPAVALALVERRRERRSRGAPLLPPSVLRLGPMRVGLAVVAPFFVVFGGFLFSATLLLQDGLRLPAPAAGIALTPLGVAMLVLSLLADRLVTRFGRTVVTVGAGLLAGGALLVAAGALLAVPTLGALALLPGTLVFGAGFGLISPTAFRIVLSAVPPDTAGVGSGVLATTQQASVALGVGTLGSLFLALRGTGDGVPTQAVLVVSAVEAGIALVIALVSRRLPDPRTRS